MSNSNEVQVIFEEETTFGAVPGGGSATVLRMTGESLGGDVSYAQSQEIQATREVAGRFKQSVSASGDLNFELSYDAFDEWLVAMLLSDADWSNSGANLAVITANTSTSAALADNSFNHTTAWTNIPAANTWIKVSGFVDAQGELNGWHKISSSSPTGTKIIVTTSITANETAGAAVTIVGCSQVVNGTTFRSYHIEREYTDLSSDLERFAGMVVDGSSFNIQADEIITGAFSFLGKIASSASSAFDATPTAAATNDVFNAIDNVVKIMEGGVDTTEDVLSIGISLANNHRARSKVGTLGAFSVGTGTMDLTGSMQFYYDGATVFNKYLNGTESSFAIILQDPAGNAYIFDVPALKYTNGRRVSGGLDQDVVGDMQWGAYRHATEQITMRVAKYTAP